MDSRTLTLLLVKLSGILIVLFYATQLPVAVLGVLEAERNTSVAALILPFSFAILLGLGLLFMPTRITNLVISPSDKAQPYNTHALEVVGLRLLGIYFFVDGLLDLPFRMVRAYYSHAQNVSLMERGMAWPAPLDIVGLASSAMQLALALWLIFWAPALIEFLCLNQAKVIEPEPQHPEQ